LGSVAPCKKMPVFTVNKVVDEKRILGKRGLRQRGH
jgi:hypothetical protein